MGMTYVHLEAAKEDTLLGALTTAHHNVVAKSMEKKAARSAAKKTTGTKAKIKR